jgi:hypothetical protein
MSTARCPPAGGGRCQLRRRGGAREDAVTTHRAAPDQRAGPVTLTELGHAVGTPTASRSPGSCWSPPLTIRNACAPRPAWPCSAASHRYRPPAGVLAGVSATITTAAPVRPVTVPSGLTMIDHRNDTQRHRRGCWDTRGTWWSPPACPALGHPGVEVAEGGDC